MSNTSGSSSVTVDNLPIAPVLAPSDRILVLYNAISNTFVSNGSPSVRTISISNIASSMLLSNTVPVTSSSNGVAGSFAYDSSYFYVCVSSNIWLRTSLTSW